MSATVFTAAILLQGVELGINPLYFMIAATVSASYAFMLPVATPPNAMAFSYGYLKVHDMVGFFVIKFLVIGCVFCGLALLTR